MDIYYEQNVVNNNIDEQQRKTKSLSFAKMACMCIGVFLILTGAMFFGLWWVVITAIMIAVPFFVAAIIIGKINKRNNMEYDYVLTDESLSVSEIYYRARRKLKHKIALRNIESIGSFNSDAYKRAQATAVKKQLALVNYEDEKFILYVLYHTDKGKKILFLEPDRGFIGALRRCITSAYGIIDKSVTELDMHLARRDAEIAGITDGGEYDSAPYAGDKTQIQSEENDADGGEQ